jgi:hypothetical protein
LRGLFNLIVSGSIVIDVDHDSFKVIIEWKWSRLLILDPAGDHSRNKSQDAFSLITIEKC